MSFLVKGPAFGFEPLCPHNINEELVSTTAKVMAFARNFMKCLGYIVGPVIGFIRIVSSLICLEGSDRKSQIVRGLVEFCGVGIVLLLLDIVWYINEGYRIYESSHAQEIQSRKKSTAIN